MRGKTRSASSFQSTRIQLQRTFTPSRGEGSRPHLYIVNIYILIYTALKLLHSRCREPQDPRSVLTHIQISPQASNHAIPINLSRKPDRDARPKVKRPILQDQANGRRSSPQQEMQTDSSCNAARTLKKKASANPSSLRNEILQDLATRPGDLTEMQDQRVKRPSFQDQTHGRRSPPYQKKTG